MPATILRFPDRWMRSQIATSPAVNASIDVPLGEPNRGLTPHDMSTLGQVISTTGGQWLCASVRDSAGQRWAVIEPCDPEHLGYIAFLVCRADEVLVLYDLGVSGRRDIVDVYEDAEALADALREMVGWQP
jgi:hypothetical protein